MVKRAVVIVTILAMGGGCKGSRSQPERDPASGSGSASTPAPEAGPPPQHWDVVWQRELGSGSPAAVTQFPSDMHATAKPRLAPATPGPTVIPAQLAQLVNVERLWLGKLGLARVPTAILGLRKLTALALDYNQIADVAPLAVLTSLVELHLGGNKITDAASLAALDHLAVLDLSSNQLGAVPAAFATLPLRELRLANNQLASCPTQLPATLEVLDLSENQITEVPAAVVALPALKSLRLSQNTALRTLPLEALAARTTPLELDLAGVPLPDAIITQLLALRDQQKVTFSSNITPTPTTLADALDHPQFATSIGISNTDLVRGKLPDSVWTLANLTELDLTGLGLADLPPGLAKLTKLRALHLGRNRLARVPASVLALTSLETLALDENRLTTLPAELAALDNLKVLDLFGNQLAELPPVVLELENLEHLDLDGNPLTARPDSLRAYTKLRRVYWPIALDERSAEQRTCTACAGGEYESSKDDCYALDAADGSDPPFAGVDPVVVELRDYPNVRVLKLVGLCAGPGAPVQSIPEDVSACAHLRVLDASDGKITTVPESLGELRRLAKLDLSNNRLRKLPSIVLQLPYLEELDLRNNKIRSLPPALAKLPRLRRLHVAGNPIPQTALQRFERLIPADAAGSGAGSGKAQ